MTIHFPTNFLKSQLICCEEKGIPWLWHLVPVARGGWAPDDGSAVPAVVGFRWLREMSESMCLIPRKLNEAILDVPWETTGFRYEFLKE